MPFRAFARRLLILALVAVGIGWAAGALAQAVDTAAAIATIGNQGLLGALCVILIAALLWAIREAGSARAELRQNDKDRLADVREVTELMVTASRNMAAVATALEANNRSTIEGNAFRQQLAQAMEGLEKASDTQILNLGNQAGEMRAAVSELRAEFGRLNEAVRQYLNRGAQ